MGEHKRLPSSQVGLHADRGCTNCFFSIFFLLAWGAMIYVAILAVQKGDLSRLVYGVDYLGNICSKTKDPCEGVTNCNFGTVPFSERKFLWYPITFDTQNKKFLLQDALKLGVCVDKCPTLGESVPTYGQLGNSTTAPPSSYRSLFTSRPLYHRCAPNFLTFDCPSGSSYGDCISSLNGTGLQFETMQKIGDAVDNGMAEVKEFWWIALVCILICILLSFLWLFILRRFVKPVVVLTCVLVFVALGTLGGLLFWKHQQLKETEPTNETAQYYFGGAIAAWIVTFLYLCVLAFLFKDIMIACDIIEEASKIPIKMPTMMIVPPVLMVLLIPFLFFSLFIAANIYTAAKTITTQLPTPDTNYNGNSGTGMVTLQTYQFENWRIYAQLFNLFMFLWTAGFIHAIGFMIIAFCSIFWYWSNPGDDKDPEAGVCKATGLCLKNHLGTLALGSLIIAIIQILRVMLLIVEHRLQKMAEHATLMKFLVRCAQCCLAYMERVIKFINKNAYIVCCMTGESFLPAARHALSLLLENALSVGAVSIIGEYIMIFGKLLITAVSGIVAWAIMGSQKSADNPQSGWVIIIAVAIISYFIACIFVNVFGVCIDSVLLSYCYDLSENNGQDKPYYFPSDLAKHVETARERKQTAMERKREMENEKRLVNS